MSQMRKISSQQHHRNLRVVYLVIGNMLAGAALGAVFAAMMVWFDLGGIGRLILNADPIWQPIALLFGGFAVTFGSIVAGTAIMLIPADDHPAEDPPGGSMITVPAVARRAARD